MSLPTRCLAGRKLRSWAFRQVLKARSSRPSQSAAYLSGSKGSKVFKGATAQESIEYVSGGPYLPSRGESGLQGALEGLWQSATGAEFDPAFDKGGALFAESSSYGELSDFLGANSLGFLVNGAANPDGTLTAGEFVNGAGVDGLSGVSGAYIVLKELPQAIIRGMLVDLIRQYNENLGLSGGGGRQVSVHRRKPDRYRVPFQPA